MSGVHLTVKICGVTDAAAVAAAAAGGAGLIGFVFYPRSPRYVTPEAAAALAALVPAGLKRVGLFADAGDDQIAATLAACPLEVLQLHGGESPDRVAAIARQTGRRVMKAISVSGPEDVALADDYAAVADWLLFDAKPPRDTPGMLPGGNALSFDWGLLAGRRFARPWMLSGGLTPENLAHAVTTSGAERVDVSSGVESAPGRKDPARIAAFLAAAAAL